MYSGFLFFISFYQKRKIKNMKFYKFENTIEMYINF